MSIANWCILIAAVMPYPLAVIAKAGLKYDNNAPRAQLALLDGYRQRANWAQLNAFEAFPAFAAAVIIAEMQMVTQSTVDTLALIFIAMRVLHGAFYILDKATLRSLAWALGFLCVIGLFVLAGLC